MIFNRVEPPLKETKVLILDLPIVTVLNIFDLGSTPAPPVLTTAKDQIFVVQSILVDFASLPSEYSK